MGPQLTNGEVARCQTKVGRVRSPLHAARRWRIYDSYDSYDSYDNLTNLSNLGYLRKNLFDSRDLQCDFEDNLPSRKSYGATRDENEDEPDVDAKQLFDTNGWPWRTRFGEPRAILRRT